MHRLFKFLSISLLAAIANPAFAKAKSDTINIGVPNWPSAQATAHIIGQLLEGQFELETNLQRLGTLGIFVGIDSGSIHVHPEIWQPSLNVLVDRYATQKKTLTLGKKPVSATQNICVTKETVKATGIKNVSDLSDPVMAAKFDTNNDGKGEIWIGDKLWPSTKIERIRARSYGYDKTMQLLQASETVAMASVDASVAVGRPVAFYCYWPHHVFQLHDITVLKEEPHNPEKWSITDPADDPAWLSKSTATTSWSNSKFQLGYASSLNETNPSAAQFLGNVEFSPRDIAWMSYAMQVERMEPQLIAEKWISENMDRVKKWMK